MVFVDVNKLYSTDIVIRNGRCQRCAIALLCTPCIILCRAEPQLNFDLFDRAIWSFSLYLILIIYSAYCSDKAFIHSLRSHNELPKSRIKNQKQNQIQITAHQKEETEEDTDEQQSEQQNVNTKPALPLSPLGLRTTSRFFCLLQRLGILPRPYALELEERHYISSPRVLAGQALVNLASSAIDISDGVIADLKHILKRSEVGASIDVSCLPISPELRQFASDVASAQQYALTSGEEYELCFTVPEENKGSLESALSHTGTKVTCIGQIRPVEYFELHNNGEPLSWNLTGYDHFKVN